ISRLPSLRVLMAGPASAPCPNMLALASNNPMPAPTRRDTILGFPRSLGPTLPPTPPELRQLGLSRPWDRPCTKLGRHFPLGPWPLCPYAVKHREGKSPMPVPKHIFDPPFNIVRS